jgi:hypothetical protein
MHAYVHDDGLKQRSEECTGYQRMRQHSQLSHGSVPSQRAHLLEDEIGRPELSHVAQMNGRRCKRKDPTDRFPVSELTF